MIRVVVLAGALFAFGLRILGAEWLAAILGAVALVAASRLTGAIALAWRPLRGVEARPHHLLGGLGWVGLVFGIVALVRPTPDLLGRMVVGCGALGACVLLLCDWYGRRVTVAGGELRFWSGLGRGWRAPAAGVGPWELAGRAVQARAPNGRVRRLPLAMEGMDGVLAALARDGAAAPPWPALDAARQRAR